VLSKKAQGSPPPLLDETQIFALWTINDLKELLKRFRNQIHGFAIVEAQFESIMAFKPNLADHVHLELLFEILDNDHDGRIDGLELLGGLTLVCQATFEEKARFAFELFDFNLNSTMSKKELIMMMMSCVCGMNLLTGGSEALEPEMEVYEALADDAVIRADKNSDGQVSYEEFLYWGRSSRDLMAALEAIHKMSSDAKMDVNPVDSASETDDDYLSESDTGFRAKVRAQEGVIVKAVRSSADNNDQLLVLRHGDEQPAVAPWLGQVFEPTNFRKKKDSAHGPDTNLELSWAFGYSAEGARNNVRYIGGVGVDYADRLIVYYTAALGVVYCPKTRQQSFYMGHSDAITCIALHPGNQIVATGDVRSNIHIWNMDVTGKVTALSVMKGIVREGVMHLLFSPNGDRIASVGRDNDHTVCFHCVNTEEIISSTQGLQHPNTVYDIAYNETGTELVLVGKQQIKFCYGTDTLKRAVETYMGEVGSMGKLQTFFCVTYFREDCIVGCASGELYRFRDTICIEVIQAHGIREPVLCLFTNRDGTMISGGKDCLIKTWDYTLHPVGEPIDISEDVDGDGKADNGSLDCTIISLQQWDSKLLLSTRGGDIFEADVPNNPGDPHTLSRIAWGHAKGELWGLAVHPLRDEFATCGDDKTLRIWSVRSHEQLHVRVMPDRSRSLAYSPSGEVLCLGMLDGSMALMEPQHPQLRVYSTWQHAELIITDIKFSPDGQLIAAGSGDSNIYLYKSEDKKNFFRQGVCRGHGGCITHLDFSCNSLYIQSNGADSNLLFWDVEGNQVKNSANLRDVTWATNTCKLAWPVQGIWSSGGDYTHVNSLQALPDIGDIVTGDDHFKVRLYKYPALETGALHQAYVGHASHVSCVRFTASRRYVVSTGGADRTILLWSHQIELDESDVEDLYSSSASSSNDEFDLGVETRHEIADVGLRSLELEAVNMGWSAQELKEYVLHKKGQSRFLDTVHDNGGGKSPGSVMPWKSYIVQPSAYQDAPGATDVDLNLKWVHGHRSYDCRNNVLYSASGSIVYNAASLAVVYNKGAGKQQFLQGAHIDEVVGIAAHPAGQIFATGEAGSQPSIIVWNSKDMQVQSRIQRAHERGVPLLAFNSRGNVLASIGLDADSSLCLHEWHKGVEIIRTPTDKGKILCMCFLVNDLVVDPNVFNEDGASTRDVVVTAGERHLKFWWTQGQNVQSQRALWGRHRAEKKSTIMCVASANRDVCVSGSSTGRMMIWKSFRAVCDVRTTLESHNSPEDLHVDPLDPASDHTLVPFGQYPHSSAVQCIWAVPGVIDVKGDIYECLEGYQASARYLTGDNQGQVAIWRMVETVQGNLQLVLMKSFNVSQLNPPPLGASVRSVCMRDGILLLGLKSSEIFEVSEAAFPFAIPKRTLGMMEGGIGGIRGVGAGAGAEISLSGPLSVKAPVPAQRLIIGHSTGEVWGLSVHPFLPLFITSGDDCTLKCWSLATHKLISYIVLPDKCRAICIEPVDAACFALALNSGIIWVLSTQLLLNPDDKKAFKGHVDPSVDGRDVSSLLSAKHPPRVVTGPEQWMQVLKYSFDASLLAAGSHDNKIYLFDTVEYKLLHVLGRDSPGHSSYITHLDFGLLLKKDFVEKDSETELKDDPRSTGVTRNFTLTEEYDPESRMILGARTVTTTLSAMVSLVPQKLEESREVTALPPRAILAEDICLQTASASFELMFWLSDGTRMHSATAMKDAWWASFSCPFGWPVQGIWPLEADGTEINAVARSHTWDKVPVLATGDNFGRVRLYNYPCIMPGASDKCYKGHAQNITNLAFSNDDAYCISIGGTDKCVFVWETDIQDEIRERAAYAASSVGGQLDAITENEEVLEVESDVEDEDYNLFKASPRGGDEMGAVKPWKGAVREPSSWKDKQDHLDMPDASLELKFVYGYRGWDCRNNLSFADSRFEVVYHIAGVGVVFNTQQNKQLHNTEHDDDILCLDVHPEGHTVATGEIGKFPKIVLWDANTGVTIRVILFHKRGVANIAFSANGDLLVSTGMDDDRTVVVHNTRTGSVLGKGKAGRGIEVYTLSVGGNELFVTGGKGHIKFWELPLANSPGGELSSKSGIYNVKAVKARTVVSSAFLGADAVTGMSDGHILLWKDRSSTKYRKAHQGPVNAMYSISNTSPGIDTRELGPRVITGGKDGFVHIWCMQLRKMWSLNLAETLPKSVCPQIQAIATKENRLLIGTKASEIYEVSLLSHAEVFKLVEGHFDTRGEVWGVAAHPRMQRFVTCGDDMTVRLWEAKGMKQLEIVHMGAKVRAVCIYPDGSQIAVATYEGRVHILSADLHTEVAQVTVSSHWIETMAYSPDGKLLAVGSHDSTIYLLETRAYSCKSKCRGHHSYISGLDFSADSTVLQSISGDYELLFWNATTGRQITSPTEVRDVKWATCTCKLGWPVQGVWSNADGTDINSVDRSPDGTYLVTGDDCSLVKLFKFPCTRPDSVFKEYKGHAQHVMKVRFSFDGRYVFSVGGLDKAILQFEVKKDSSSRKNKMIKA